jgi:V8-like Glu-specific endopeptidase/endonuclease/exonuclease/phosphatase (EEP) superfamily protein YafD
MKLMKRPLFSRVPSVALLGAFATALLGAGCGGGIANEDDSTERAVPARLEETDEPSIHPALRVKRENPAAYDAVAALERLPPESQCGANNLQFVNAYDGTLGESISFVTDHKGPVGAMTTSPTAGAGNKFCSGTLIGTNVFLTASHCVGSTTVGQFVSFNYELSGAAGSPALTESFFRIGEIIDDNTSLDFAIVRLQGDPGGRFDWTDIDEAGTNINDLITIVQHPSVEPKQVEVGHVASLTTDTISYGDLDTMPGSSGSGILDHQGRLVGVHTNGGCTATGGTNSGSRMTRALALSGALTSISRGTNWELSMNWCNHEGSQLFIGDFNGDGRSDMLCHDSAGNKWTALANESGQFTGTSWSAGMNWCNHEGSQLFIGDFNGDGRSDMLCHDSAGNKWTALADESGQFPGTSWSAGMNWCNHEGSQLFIGDFNGDGRSDLLCHDAAGNKWTALADSLGQFSGTSWSAGMNWCNHEGSQLFIGDFNGDGRSDLLCHDTAGNKWTALADDSGQFTGTSWSAGMNWCNHDGSRLLIGDFNGDGRSDLLCHDAAGNKWTALANSLGEFTGTSWSAGMNWCSNGSQLFVGKFNGDRRSDMLCHDSAGHKWLSNARRDGSF